MKVSARRMSNSSVALSQSRYTADPPAVYSVTVPATRRGVGPIRVCKVISSPGTTPNRWPAPSPPRHPRRGDCQEPPPPFLLQDPTVRGHLGRKCVPKPPHLRLSCSSHPHSKAGKQTGAPVSHL